MRDKLEIRRVAHTNRRAVQDYDDGIFRLTATEPGCDHDEHLNKIWEGVLLFSRCFFLSLLDPSPKGDDNGVRGPIRSFSRSLFCDSYKCYKASNILI